jgi:hypothetical protein
VIRVARWFIFKPKIPFVYILVGLGKDNVGFTYLMAIKKYFRTIWQVLLPFGVPILWSFSKIFPVFVCCAKNFWQT